MKKANNFQVMYEMLSKKLHTEREQLGELLEREQQLRKLYEEYMQVKEERENKEKLIHSLEVVLQDMPVVETEQVKRPKKARNTTPTEKKPVQESISNYVYQLLQNVPNGLKNKEIAAAIQTGLNLQLKSSHTIFRALAKDSRFARVGKTAWKLAK